MTVFVDIGGMINHQRTKECIHAFRRMIWYLYDGQVTLQSVETIPGKAVSIDFMGISVGKICVYNFRS